VAATNEGIGQLVSERRMRADLAHRIGAVVLQVPALAERPSDIPLLVRHFLDSAGRGHLPVTNEALSELQGHHWPGNVRELKQVVEWAAVMATTTLTADTVNAAMRQRAQSKLATEPDGTERLKLRDVLARHRWNAESAARELGVHRATLYRRMKVLRLTALSPRRGRAGQPGETEARVS
jgi:DNA-binding NtrC family response regulator